MEMQCIEANKTTQIPMHIWQCYSMKVAIHFHIVGFWRARWASRRVASPYSPRNCCNMIFFFLEGNIVLSILLTTFIPSYLLPSHITELKTSLLQNFGEQKVFPASTELFNCPFWRPVAAEVISRWHQVIIAQSVYSLGLFYYFVITKHRIVRHIFMSEST